ncbi:MAG: VWA domain-containing protein [Desulfobacterales bacterium]|nr:VWA domain-containing protein [Desulfobacterales bacterium]MBF0395917.1 VWA domain-containing protein [Desulfobacterales bacterium]
MTGKPKPAFWIVVALVVIGLTSFSLYRAKAIKKSDTGVTINDVSNSSALGISFYTSSAKKTWIDEMIKEFHASNKNIKIKAFHGNSGDNLDDLKAGKIKPDIWSPGDESWLQLALSYYRDVKQKVLFEEYKPLVNIPLIIAMWEPMAKVLGYPKPISWKDIYNVASKEEGWTALGHSEWGKFRWGHAHPDANSGFLTIISEIYAALNKTEGITTDDLKKPEVISFLHDFESAVEHYGLSNTWIDDIMHIKGPSYLSATVQYENTIIETNAKHKNKPFKLVAIYPTEGNIWTRHPIAILDGEWMTPEKKEACKKFIDFLLSKDAQTKAMKMGLRPIIKDIVIESPFDEEHGVIDKVNSDKAFTVPDESVLKRIRDLWEDVKVPATVILVIDISGSMKGEPIDSAKQGAVQFIKAMKPRDELKVVVFNNIITTLSDMCSIQQCGEGVISRIQGIFADRGTALYDAMAKCYVELSKLKKDNPKRRYNLLILSDGKDTASSTRRDDFVDMLPRGEDYNVPKIYSIAYGSEADKDLLAEISNKTNGRLFISSPEEIVKTYKELSANF